MLYLVQNQYEKPVTGRITPQITTYIPKKGPLYCEMNVYRHETKRLMQT